MPNSNTESAAEKANEYAVSHSERVFAVEDRQKGDFYRGYVRLNDARFENKGDSITLPLYIDLSAPQSIGLIQATKMLHVHIRKTTRMYIFTLGEVEFQVPRKQVEEGQNIMREKTGWIIEL